MVARQGNDILVVTALEKVLYDDAVDQAASTQDLTEQPPTFCLGLLRSKPDIGTERSHLS